MRRTRIYLDTTIINFLFADDAPEKKEATIDFFENYVRPGVYEVFISQIVIDEINRTKDKARREDLLAAIEEYALLLLSLEQDYQEIESLAQAYIQTGVIPRKKGEDALHVAIATVTDTDVLLSWNFRHLANVGVETRVQAANLLEGYSKPLRMTTPLEVMYEDND